MAIRNGASREATWRAHYQLLLGFVDREGHSRVPVRHEERGFRLGRWVHAQRQNRESLGNDRRKALEAIEDWCWTGQDAKWNRAFGLLRQFAVREGHALVPKPHIEADFALGVWVMHQRAAYRKGRLADERVKRLDKVKGWAWYPRDVVNPPVRAGMAGKASRRIISLSDDELAEEGWKILFGLGTVTLQAALELVAAGFFDKGFVRSKSVKLGTKNRDYLCGILEKAVSYGYMDVPRPGHFRAILADPEDYEPEDWRMCLFNSIEDESMERDEAIVRAAKWARANLGLSYLRLTRGGPVWKKLEAAVEAAVRAKEIKQTVFYGVVKIQSLI